MSTSAAGSGITLVSLHAWPPEAAGAVGLRKLDDALRSRGVEVVAIDGPHDTLPTTMAEWIADFDLKLARVEAKLARPPALLGYCLSAAVAMALAQTRPEVPYVGLVDMWLPLRRVGRGHHRHYGVPLRMIPGDLLALRRAQETPSWRAIAAESVRDFNFYRRERRDEPERAAKRVTPASRVIHRVGLLAPPTVCRVPVHLYPAEKSVSTRTPGDLSLGWSRYLQAGYRSTPIPGSHVSCFHGPGGELLCDAIVRDLGISAGV
ncbi:MAG: hypothetical protein JWL70_2301 [Acidimicrobiia bacterium]|nr:hypothetical protein [Acidimicrobiia bacterium]